MGTDRGGEDSHRNIFLAFNSLKCLVFRRKVGTLPVSVFRTPNDQL